MSDNVCLTKIKWFRNNYKEFQRLAKPWILGHQCVKGACLLGKNLILEWRIGRLEVI